MSNRQLTKEERQLKEKIYKHLSYTSQDYESILGDIISLFRSQDLNTEWDNLSEADPIFILMHLLAAHKDILNYMLDYRVLETYALTARERASLIRLANSVGYKIPGLVPSYADYSLTIEEGEELPAELHILPGQTFSFDNETWTYIDYIDYVIPAEEPYNLFLGLVQGTPSLVEFTGRDINTNNNSFTLAGNNIASYRNTPYRTSYLSTDDDVDWEWEEVDNLVGRSINDYPKPYMIDKDTAGLYYIKFPNDMTLYTEDYKDVRFSLTYVSTDGDKVVKAPSTLSAVITDNNSVNQTVTLEHEHNNYTFIQGLPEATADEVKEGYKNYRGTLQSLSTLEDYKQFMLTKQTVVPNVDKVMVIDTQASTNPDIETFDVFPLGSIGIYFTLDTYGNEYANEYLDPSPQATQADKDVLDNLLNEFDRYRQAGVKIGLNKEPDNDGAHIKPLPISVFFTSTGSDKANQGIMRLIREYIGAKDIGSQLSVKELERLILMSEYNDYFINTDLTVELKVGDTNEDKEQTGTHFNEFLSISIVDTKE